MLPVGPHLNPGENSTRYTISSGERFTDRLEEYAETQGILLVGIDELMGRVPPGSIWDDPRTDEDRRHPPG